jgi:NhaP-type Na+/H+ or K+/H+ antiporter
LQPLPSPSASGCPARIVEILEGESLINDATGLLALEFAIGMVVSRHVPTITEGLLTLLWLVVSAASSLALLVAWIVCIVAEHDSSTTAQWRLRSASSSPYAAYFHR